VSQIEIDISDSITPELKHIEQRLDNRRDLHVTIGQRVAVLCRRHFLKRNSEGNRRNWPRSNFWLRFQDTIQTADDRQATVSIPDEQGALRHKIKGGTITPKRSKFLAIPLAPEAKKAGADTTFRQAFPDAFVLQGKRRAFLAQPGINKGSRGSIRILAVLVRSVTHAADPRALPATRSIEQEAVTGATNYLARLKRRLTA